MSAHVQTRAEFEYLPIELVEEIAWQLPLAGLRSFRLSGSRNAAAGLKPLLYFVPGAVSCSTLQSPRGVPCRQLSDLAAISRFRSIANVITSLTVGKGASKLDLLSQICLPNLSFFRMIQVEIESSQGVTIFLSNHANTLTSMEIREVDITCPLTEGDRHETLPQEWQAILRASKELPNISDLMILDIGYYNQQRDMRYKIWFHQESIYQNERLRREATGRYDALIRAKAAHATAKWAVQAVVDAVLLSTGKKVFQFQIAY